MVGLVLALVVIVGAIVYLNSTKVERAGSGAEDAVDIVPREETPSEPVSIEQPAPVSPVPSPIDKSKKYDVAKEITTPDGFINTEGVPVTIQNLIGKKVVLIDFWTYSCINCQRTTPYLNDWYSKYKDQGLEIVGIHTPEFDFEKNYENVVDAVNRFGIKYPVVLDNDFSTWGAYHNQYWPRKYLIDIDGYIVYDHIGEGGYEATEAKIQELLKERKKILGERGEVTGVIKKEDPNPVPRALSPEIYFGATRNEYLANGKRGSLGTQVLNDPGTYELNSLYLAGSWNIQNEYAENSVGSAKIFFTYKANNVFFVASTENSDGIRIKVLVDGKPLDSSMRGEDVSADGTVTIKADGLYRLIKNSGSGEHKLELQIEKAGLKAFTFTFG